MIWDRLQASSFVRHVLQLMTGTALSQIVAIIVQLAAMKLYSGADFGGYAVVTAVVGGLVTIASLRYDLTIVLPVRDADARHLVRLTSRINAAVAGTALVVLWLVRHPVAELLVRGTGPDDLARRAEVAAWLPAAAPLTWVMQQLLIVGYWLNRHQRYRDLARNKIAQSVGVGAGQLGLGAAGAGTLGLIVGQLAGLLAALALVWARTRPSLDAADDRHAAGLLRRYRRMPLLNGPSAVADAIRVNGITMLLGASFGLTSLGQFNRAWALLQAPIALINGALQQVFYQRLATTPRDQMLRTVRTAILRSAALGIIPFALIHLLAPPLFRWFDPQWTEAGVLAAALVPWLYLTFITSPVSSVFLVVEQQGLLMGFSVVFMAVPLALLWWHRSDLVGTVHLVSWVMAVLLLGFCGLALYVAHRCRNGTGPGEPAPDGGRE